MKKFGCVVIAGPLLLFGLMVMFINILPGLMVEDFAMKLPAARPKLERWILSGLPEGQEYSDEDVAWINQNENPGENFDYYYTGQVYNGGVVEFLDYSNLEPSFVCGLVSTQITDCYGTARGEQYNDHSGIDYSAAEGMPVQTPMGGVVSYAGALGSYGNLVVIESNGYQIYFAHNSAITVKTGEIVTAGETISLAGSTGFSTGAHVHFEVRHCDQETGYCTPVNPNSVVLPGAAAACDFYFDQTVYVYWDSGLVFTCGVDDTGSFFVEYECETQHQKNKPWCH